MQYGIILSRDQPMSGLLSAQNSMKSADKYGRDRYHPPAVGAPERLLYLTCPMENLSVLRCLSVFDAQRGTNRVQCLGVQPAH